MQLADSALNFSASDLVAHLNCRYLTKLDLAVANGSLAKPTLWDPVLETLAERGLLHEKNFVAHLEKSGLTVASIDGVGVDETSVGKTLAAMRAGTQVIVQAALQAGRWGGRADVLRRVEKPSALGAWSYEVIDAKLARETKGSAVLQVCLYSDLLSGYQKLVPEFAYIVAPGSEYEANQFRVDDFSAYYRRVRKSLEDFVGVEQGDEIYPDPNPHCDVCRWRLHCDTKRRTDDHLSLVASISKAQIGELKKHAINTVADLAIMPIPLQWKPERGAVQSYEKTREQARIQIQGRNESKIVFEILPIVQGFGLSILPEPSKGDIFFDLEADPYVEGGGLEFLFGYAFHNEKGETEYKASWALNRAEEKAAFEAFIDFVIKRMETYPDLHIFHFAPYEPAALKRLMGRYVSKENEIDRMLRAGLFVDLFSVVRHGIRASVESYSIKKLEALYAFKREILLQDASKMLAKVQASLELNDGAGISKDDCAIVESYNKDDCLSTLCLRDWLEKIRLEVIAKGTNISRPLAKSADPSEDLTDWQKKIEALVVQLIDGVPIDPVDRSVEQHARWLLAYLLDWHRREDKAAWWEYFRLAELSVEDLVEERAGISGLTFVEAVGGTTAAPIHRYHFPPQDTELRGDEELHSPGGQKLGKVDSISLENRTIDIKKRKDTAGVHSQAAFAHQVISAQVLAESLVRIGEHTIANGLSGDGPYKAARDLLLRSLPQFNGAKIREDGETPLAAAARIGPTLNGVLPIQGPPGAGKTHTGARMICALVKAGKTVGITANSHKVIRNLLDAVVAAATEASQTVNCLQKVREKEDNIPGLQFTTKNDALSGIGSSFHVVGGTAWLWAGQDAHEAVDVLVIDEAAQMSLANVLAVSQAAKSVVLLGDPQQLEQPIKGSHPEGTDVSALNHILGEHATIPADRGLFLEETWRLHPEICAFTSEMFYESRLRSRVGLEAQTIKSSGRISGTGLRFLAVPHTGNQNCSLEEAQKIKELVDELLSAGTTWVDREGSEEKLRLEDILIIAPYNVQVFELQALIPGARIGTVDKFQGQEAPLVIYSMTTSTHADAPRGMEFLYSANRLNVATSRAKCICVIVGSPAVFEAECRSPRQMQLANAFCRYLEMAEAI